MDFSLISCQDGIPPSIKSCKFYLIMLAAATIFDVLSVGAITYSALGEIADLKKRVVNLKMKWQLSAMKWVNDVPKALGESSMGISKELRLKIDSRDARDHLSIMIERGKINGL